jgi:choline kinase
MKAIILAAGVGKRLWPQTAECPKCLLQFDGHTLLARMLTALERADIREVVIVVGYLKRKIVEAVARSQTGLPVRYVENPRYQKGSMLSLWRVRKELDQDLLILDADVLCSPALLARLVYSDHENAVLLDPRVIPSGEEMMLAARQGRVWHIGRQVPGIWDTVGESVGFYKLSEEASQQLRQSVELCFRQGKIHADYEHALLPVLRDCVVGYELVGDAPWMEIDTPADVERAEREIVPQLLLENRR